MKLNTKKIFLFIAALLMLTACAPAQVETIESIAGDAPELSLPAHTEEVAEEVSLPSTEAPTETLLATPTAEPRFEIIIAPALRKIEMLDSQNGWGQAEGMILRTEDGGETWLNISPENIFSDPAYAPSFFLDARTGWVLLANNEEYSQSVLYKTIDGGATWMWRNMPFGRADIGFLDAEKGYILENLGAGAGSNGVGIWTTENGGDDYNRVFLHEPGYDASLPISGIKNGIFFTDSQNGWVVGSQPQDGYIWLYRTEDGGFSWTHQDLALPFSYENAQTSIYAPVFFENGLAILPVYLYSEESATVFYRTVDNGERWTATSPLLARGKYAIVSADEIILWDGNVRIYSSDDSGETWGYRETDWQPADTLLAIDFISATEGWALSDEGLYGSKDGGLTWGKLGH
ncbi:MAG: hypothetical protein HN392_12510 [Anaerolineae bacterium]|jgi:photosystem II stability/assembly factor-like uncharacterized protein|nr:hypothetical protein [Anaerolineae bacterium]MBT7073694.1 hypothetical protein [Anaerolineae bacterium]MBT7781402.1 hypothetical protein [Anaerolineae bacterium]